MRDQKLEDAGHRDSRQAQHDVEVQANLLQPDSDAVRALEQNEKLVEDAETAARGGRDGRARHAQARKRSPAEDQAGVEDKVDQV